MSSLKKLVLKIVHLHEDDQKWILDQLSDLERQHVEQLITEVKSLALEFSPNILDDLLEEDTEISSLETQVKNLSEKYAPIWIVLWLRASGSGFNTLLNGLKLEHNPQFCTSIKKYSSVDLPVHLKNTIVELVS